MIDDQDPRALGLRNKSNVINVTSITAWGDARCREMLLCSHLLLPSSSLKHDVAPVPTSSPAVPLAYKERA
jgi:hypothetical protein